MTRLPDGRSPPAALDVLRCRIRERNETNMTRFNSQALPTHFGLERFAADGLAAGSLRAATWLVLLILSSFTLGVSTGSTEMFVLAALAGIVIWFRRHRTPLRPFAPEERIAALGYGAFVATVLFSVAEQGAAYHVVRELDTLLRPILAIPLVYLMIRTRPPEAVFWLSMGLCAILAGGNAILTVAATDGHVLVRGGLYHIHYGAIAIAAGFISLLGLAYFRRFAAAYIALALLALGLGLAAGFLSGSRGAWTTLPALVTLLVWHHWQPGMRRYAIGGAIAIVAAGALAFALPQTGVEARFDKAVDEVERYFEDPARHGGTSVGARFEMWRAGWHLFAEHPISGGGMGQSFNRFARAGVEQGRYHPVLERIRTVHNAYFQALVTRGLIGFAGFAALLGALGYVYWRAARAPGARRRALGTAGLMLLAAYMFVGLTDTIFDYGRPLHIFVVYSALIVHLIGEAPADDEAGPMAASEPSESGDASSPAQRPAAPY